MKPSETSRFVQFLRNVKRSRRDKILGGVCGGFAAHSDIPIWAYRVIFIAFATLQVGLLAYIALWIFMPAEGVSGSVAEKTPNK